MFRRDCWHRPHTPVQGNPHHLQHRRDMRCYLWCNSIAHSQNQCTRTLPAKKNNGAIWIFETPNSDKLVKQCSSSHLRARYVVSPIWLCRMAVEGVRAPLGQPELAVTAARSHGIASYLVRWRHCGGDVVGRTDIVA